MRGSMSAGMKTDKTQKLEWHFRVEFTGSGDGECQSSLSYLWLSDETVEKVTTKIWGICVITFKVENT